MTYPAEFIYWICSQGIQYKDDQFIIWPEGEVSWVVMAENIEELFENYKSQQT